MLAKLTKCLRCFVGLILTLALSPNLTLTLTLTLTLALTLTLTLTLIRGTHSFHNYQGAGLKG